MAFQQKQGLSVSLKAYGWKITSNMQQIIDEMNNNKNDELQTLHYLLPTKRDTELINRLHSATVFPSMRMQTSRFKNSFIPFSVAKLSSS